MFAAIAGWSIQLRLLLAGKASQRMFFSMLGGLLCCKWRRVGFCLPTDCHEQPAYDRQLIALSPRSSSSSCSLLLSLVGME